MCHPNQPGIYLILHNYFIMSLGRGGGTRKRYPPGFYSDSEHNPICHPSLHMLQIREESSFIQARRKEMKPRVRVGGKGRYFQNWLFVYNYFPIVSSLVFLALSLIVTPEVDSCERKNGSKGFILKGVNTSPRLCCS